MATSPSLTCFSKLCWSPSSLTGRRPYSQPGECHIFRALCGQGHPLGQIGWTAIPIHGGPNQGASSLKSYLHAFSFLQVREKGFTSIVRTDIVQLQHDCNQTLAAKPQATVFSWTQVASCCLGSLSGAISYQSNRLHVLQRSLERSCDPLAQCFSCRV